MTANHAIVITGGTITGGTFTVATTRPVRQTNPRPTPTRAPKLIATHAGTGFAISLTTADGAHLSAWFTAEQYAQTIAHLIAVRES